MQKFLLTPDARSDLIDIGRFTLEQWGSDQSRKYLSELRETMRLLAGSPAVGKPRPELGADVLSFSRASHVIYYLVHKEHLVVFAVLHKRMVPLAHLAERDVF